MTESTDARATRYSKAASEWLDDPEGYGRDISVLFSLVYALLAIEARIEELTEVVDSELDSIARAMP